MKIRICSKGKKPHRMTIVLPTRVIFSSVTATIAANVASKEINVTGAQMRRLFSELRRARKTLGDMPLVEVLDSDGDYVRIDL